MARKRVSKGQIIMKKQEKIPKVIDALEHGFTDSDYIEKFKDMYPKDWANIERRYKQHEEINKGRSHPMAPPRKYLLNMSKKYLQEARSNEI